MLISKQIGPGGTERILLLVPELCLPTGLTDRMRSDFRFMKDLGGITISNPGPRISKCTNLVKRIYENNDCRTEMNTWGLKISDQAEKFTANKLNPGKILFNQGRTHDLSTKSSFDRESQNGFYQTPSLQKWCIFYSNNDSRLKDTLIKELQAGFQRANWTNINEPLVVGVQGNDPNAWKNAIYQYQQAQFVLLLLPGFRGKDERGLYATCKRILTSEVPIPSQVVLSGTIKSGKGITSIVSKVLTQMCAKIHGGEPWGLDNPEGLNEPTIVMGLDVYHGGANKKSIMALTGSLDRWVGRYFSAVENYTSQEEIGGMLKIMTEKAVEAFKKSNQGTSPTKIIVYRDGVSEGQKSAVLNTEVQEIRSALDNTCNNAKLVYIVLNKRITTRIFQYRNGSIESAPEGTVVDNHITKQG